MPQIMLSHPDHGIKFAMSESEVEHDEKFGWVRYTDSTPAAVEDLAAEVAPKRKYTRKVTEQPIEQPNGSEPVSDESEGN